jgi:hypothetical protein
VEWEPIAPATKATIYQVYTSALMKSWDLEIEMRGLAFNDGTSSYIDPFTIARLMPNSSVLTTADYATAIAITAAFTRTAATDDITLALSSVEMDIDEHDQTRDTAGFIECTMHLVPIDNVPQGTEVACTYTFTAHDTLAKEYYGGTT